MFDLSDYAYDLPESLIAETPASKRDDARLLVLERASGRKQHLHFHDLKTLLGKGDLLVLNDTRVIPARFFGKKETGGSVEILLLDYAGACETLKQRGIFQSTCLLRASKRPKEGMRLFLGDHVEARVERLFQDGSAFVSFFSKESMPESLLKLGEVPLPPYIPRKERRDSDFSDYQTVYAAEKGAVAAPTAGLHFTETLVDALSSLGVEIAFLTLHVGYGTFAPVRVRDIREHKMHSERFFLSKESASKIFKAKKEGKRIVATGTTSVRTLEYIAGKGEFLHGGSGFCDLFIYPGFKFQLVDAMITNFHLPETTLMMLVSAFAGRERILDAYREATELQYRFFSYGDAMFIC
ncbi:tRNA preQ1(34) S-adenosylmethionine ribosyltransferase-isomerase QueA [Desulfococcaceae bacterium OttesenSCG-928-F15]|nr:tRNA preQ1(34) S-adenosylmethionine ribosyltransferase-isomerase QueA [Desulfococcaceae bacterium OttesenSCG-928-F15]